MTITLLIVHGLVAVALLGAVTHQTLAAWAPSARARARFSTASGASRLPPSPTRSSFYTFSASLGAVLYLDFRIDIRPSLERAGQWPALGVFDLKEHFIAIGLALLPAYWLLWRRPSRKMRGGHAPRSRRSWPSPSGGAS